MSAEFCFSTFMTSEFEFRVSKKEGMLKKYELVKVETRVNSSF